MKTPEELAEELFVDRPSPSLMEEMISARDAEHTARLESARREVATEHRANANLLLAIAERDAEQRVEAARREAFADALQIFRGLAGDAMTPELETVLLMVDKAIARRVAGQ